MIVTIGGLPVYDALITDAETGMFKISLVDDPAVMSNFQAFENARKPLLYAIENEEKRLVRGCIMRADFPIYRRDGMGEYYIIYRADQIRKMAEKYLFESRQNAVNLMHREGSDVNGVNLVQYFIKGDGISVDGFDECAPGSLFGEFHITNDEVWEQVKDGTYRGFSLEGVFDLAPEQDVSQVKDIVSVLDGLFSKLFKSYRNMSKLTRFKEALAKMLQEYGNITTDKGILAWDGDEDLKEGDVVYAEDADGNRNPVEDGDYTTEDRKVIVVVDGKVAEIKDAEAEVAPEEPEAEPVAEEASEEQKFGSVNTDKGVLTWEGEEDLKAGDAVFVGEAPAEDGEYVTEDGKTIVVAEGRVAEIRDAEAEVAPEEAPSEEVEALRKENEALKAQVEELKSQVEKLEKMSAAKPAHDEVTTAGQAVKTGNKGLDRLARYLSAK